MAIATLAKVVGNRDVFTGVVKIRKGKALQLLVQTNDMQVTMYPSNNWPNDLASHAALVV